MENSVKINFEDGAVLVSHRPISVFTTTAEDLERIHRKPSGHYDREDLMTLVKEGHAILTTRTRCAPSREFLMHDCPRL
jgi:hypothetical protein